MGRTCWHITFGTYGTRLHGGDAPTVHHASSQRGEAFVANEPSLAAYQRRRQLATSVVLSDEQRHHCEETLPGMCERGDWTLHACAARPDHLHVILAADSDTHGKRIRSWLKRWLTEALNRHFESKRWWAKGGSTKPIDNHRYLEAAIAYVDRQRTSPE